jgi:transposase
MSDKLQFRTFSTAFKIAAIERVEAGEAVLPMARELGIPRKLLYGWHKAWKADGVAGLNRKRGPKPGSKHASAVLGGITGEPVQNNTSELAKAQSRIAELERLVGRQQVDLDFFRKALRALNGQEAQGKTVDVSSLSSKP